MSKITTVASTVPVVTEEGSADSAKWRFTGGFLAFSVLSGAAFYMTMSVLVPQRLRDIGIANSTAVLGTINAVGSIASIFIALFIGALSDRTATRWGRRTPWIFCGAFIYGVCFWALSRPISAVIIGLVYVLALIGLNMVQAPYLRSGGSDIACHRVRRNRRGRCDRPGHRYVGRLLADRTYGTRLHLRRHVCAGRGRTVRGDRPTRTFQ